MHREGTSSSSSTEKQAPSLPKKVGDFLFGLLFVLGLLSLPEERVGMLGGGGGGNQAFHEKKYPQRMGFRFDAGG